MQSSIYNLNQVVYRRKYKLSIRYGTFGDTSNRKVVNLCNYLSILTNQRYCLIGVNADYYRKRVLKSLIFEINLSSRNSLNLLRYFAQFYIYFFNIYYQNGLKYAFLPTFFTFYIDNPYLFFKSYSKQNQKIRFNFCMDRVMNKSDFIYLSNYFLISIHNNK
jgi:hypothetical protein